MAKPTKPEIDPLTIQRGDYSSSLLPKSLFIIGRLATGPIQYAILKAHPLGYFGVPPPPTGGFIHILGHTLPRLPFFTALMPTVLSAKHSFWVSTYCNEHMTLPFATFGVLLDLTYECVTTLVFTGSSINPLFSERAFYIGTGLYFTGIAIELVAELHRAAFKAKKENQGKLCTTGLWSVTRHINYTANVLFGFGYGLATGGLGYSIATAGMYASNFVTNAMPSIEEYCAKKYGSQWEEYTRRTKWQLIPGIY